MSRLLESIVKWGSGDVARAEEILDELDIDYDTFADSLNKYQEEVDTFLRGMDIVAAVYEHILDLVDCEIQACLGETIYDGDWMVYGNYIDTRYTNCENAHDLALRIPEEERSKVVNWFIEKTRP